MAHMLATPLLILGGRRLICCIAALDIAIPCRDCGSFWLSIRFGVVMIRNSLEQKHPAEMGGGVSVSGDGGRSSMAEQRSGIQQVVSSILTARPIISDRGSIHGL